MENNLANDSCLISFIPEKNLISAIDLENLKNLIVFSNIKDVNLHVAWENLSLHFSVYTTILSVIRILKDNGVEIEINV
jgi:hypothetical protein